MNVKTEAVCTPEKQCINQPFNNTGWVGWVGWVGVGVAEGETQQVIHLETISNL